MAVDQSDYKKNLQAMFRRIKRMTKEQFGEAMNVMHTRAYRAAESHYQEAMDVVLTPKQKEAVVAKANEIRELWDGMAEVDTKSTLQKFSKEM